MTTRLNDKSKAPPANGADGEDLQGTPDAVADAEMSVAAMSARVAAVERQLNALEQLVPLIESVQHQAESLAATQQRAEVRLGRAADDAQRVQSEMEGVSHSVEMALSLKNDITRFTELVPDTKQQLGDLEALASRVTAQIETVEQQRDAIDRGTESAKELAHTLEELEAHAQALQSLDAEVLERSKQIRSHQVQIDAQDQATLEELAAIRAAVRKGLTQVELANQEFESLNQRVAKLRGELTDLETQIAPLEESRHTVTEVRSHANDLSAQLSTIADECRGLADLEARVEDVKSLHAEVLQRSEQVAARQEEIDDGAVAALEQMTAIREDVDRNIERVETANRGFDSVSRQTEEVRETLEDFDTRLRSLDESRQAISKVQGEADDLSTRLGAVADECSRLDQEAERIRSIGGHIDELDEAVHGVEQRVVRIEQVRTEVDDMSRDLADLSRKSEAITDAMKQARLARNEISQMRDEQAETEKWMTRVQGSVDSLRHSVEDLFGMKPMVESVREEAERVSQAVTAIDSRRELLEEMDKRFGELESLGVRLDEGPAGRASLLEGSPGGKREWYFNSDFVFDRSTWEFGLQFRAAGRWKRGVALWLGPIRWFIGWERRIYHGEPASQVVEQPKEKEDFEELT